MYYLFYISDVFFVDYYCGLIYAEIESKPAKESELIRRLRRQNVSTEDVKKCLQLMETNGLIRKTRRSSLPCTRQHVELDIYSASSVKQQSAIRHVAPLGRAHA
jgi:hypothetical protein